MRNTGFQSSKHLGLQSAYADWGSVLPKGSLVVIQLDDPVHAMAAFFGLNRIGLRCGITSKKLSSAFTVLDQQLQSASITDLPLNSVTPFLTFTGGTTGAPKIIQRAPWTWVYSFKRNQVSSKDRVIILGDLTHSLALYAAAEALHQGATPIYQSAHQAIATQDATIVYGTPSQLEIQTLRHSPSKSVRIVYVGGGHLRTQLREKLVTLFPNASIHAFYGAAETSFATITQDESPKSSVGQAYEGVEISIDNDRISINSPMMFDGYIDEHGTLKNNTHLPFFTGEMGYQDQHGNLFISGRADRHVNVADKVVNLDEIENYLLNINGIQKAAVVSIQNEIRGNIICAVIQSDTKITLPLDVSIPIQPRHVIQIPDWPVMASGKTDYLAIKNLFKNTVC